MCMYTLYVSHPNLMHFNLLRFPHAQFSLAGYRILYQRLYGNSCRLTSQCLHSLVIHIDRIKSVIHSLKPYIWWYAYSGNTLPTYIVILLYIPTSGGVVAVLVAMVIIASVVGVCICCSCSTRKETRTRIHHHFLTQDSEWHVHKFFCLLYVSRWLITSSCTCIAPCTICLSRHFLSKINFSEN